MELPDATTAQEAGGNISMCFEQGWPGFSGPRSGVKATSGSHEGLGLFLYEMGITARAPPSRAQAGQRISSAYLH